MRVKPWLLLLYCCLVVILRNAEVPNGLLILKNTSQVSIIVDAVWKEPSPELLDTQKLIVSEHGVDIDV